MRIGMKERIVLKVVAYPDETLRQVCEPVVFPDPSIAELAKGMAETMYACNGVGLAAPQVGVLKRMVVIDCSPDPQKHPDLIVMVNPEIVDRSEELEEGDEGCLSCAGIAVPITRNAWVSVEYYDEEGDLWELTADELLGRCIQHELDHLDGITLFERCDKKYRLRALEEYELAKEAGAKPGETSVSKSSRK